MDPEIDTTVLNRLILYMLRYIAAYPYKNKHGNISSNHNEHLVEASFQLVCYHINTVICPYKLLIQCLSEIPLALVNIGEFLCYIFYELTWLT